MGWPKLSSLVSSVVFLVSPILKLVDSVASAAILAVLTLGVLFSRFFEEREALPVDRIDSETGTGCEGASIDASLLGDGTETPMQVCTPLDSAHPNDDFLATDVRPTPPGQMLFCDIGPTPATPAPAHPAAMTVPARRTSAPPSPTNIVPRNLDSLLLAAACGQYEIEGHATSPADALSAGAFESAVRTSTASEALLAELTADGLQPAAISTPLPAPTLGSKDWQSSQHGAVLGSPSDASGSDAALTVPRKAPTGGPVATAAPDLMLTTPVKRPALESATPLHVAVPRAADVPLGGRSLGTSGSSEAAEDAQSSGFGPHGLGALVTEAGSLGSAAGDVAVAAAVTDACRNGAPTAADAAAKASSVESTTQMGMEDGYGAAGMDSSRHQHQSPPMLPPAVALPSAPATPGPEDEETDDVILPDGGETAAADEGGGAVVADREMVSGVAGAALTQGDAETSGLSEPQTVGSPTGTPTADGIPDGATASGLGVLAAAGRSTPNAKQQDHTKLATGAASAKRVTSTPSPRLVASSPKQKRGLTSPTAGAATPATARRPVTHETVLRSPRSGGDRPVVRKLNPTSPRPDAGANPPEDGSLRSPASQSSFRSESSESSGAAGNGAVPRYAAPTAASMARKTLLPLTSSLQHPQQPQRLNSAQKLLGASVSFPGVADGMGAAVGGTESSTLAGNA